MGCHDNGADIIRHRDMPDHDGMFGRAVVSDVGFSPSARTADDLSVEFSGVSIKLGG